MIYIILYSDVSEIIPGISFICGKFKTLLCSETCLQGTPQYPRESVPT